MATNGMGWCVEEFGADGWRQMSITVSTKDEAESLLDFAKQYWRNEVRVYEVLA